MARLTEPGTHIALASRLASMRGAWCIVSGTATAGKTKASVSEREYAMRMLRAAETNEMLR
jgi:hypothetical protein